VLGLDDHVALIAELLGVMVAQTRPSLVIVSGFSASGDLLLKLAANAAEGDRLPDGVLALGPNQGIETCFLSNAFAHLQSNEPAQLFGAARQISATAGTLDEFVLLNGYLARIVSRFRADVRPLVQLGRDIVAPFERDGNAAFAAMYRAAAARVPLVRCVFEDSEVCNRLLRETLVDHMDHGSLGQHHRDGALLIEPSPGHFDLIQPECIAAHLAAMVEELRAMRS